MVFSSSEQSIPAYHLDPPNCNWPQQQLNPDPGGVVVHGSNEAPHLPAQQPGNPGAPGSVRPGSMTDRARMAKIPMPEPGLKCPRCESTNTKFCYFNNYNLSQPRHFCKTCRRYWTRGGALRSVPVGGGCRRNKRSKGSNRSKSAAAASNIAVGGVSSRNTTTTSSTDVIIGHDLPPGPSPLLPFLPPLHNLNDYVPSNIGLNFETSRKIGSIDMEFQMGNAVGAGGTILSNGLADQQWRLQHFSFFGNNNLQATPAAQVGFYPLEGDDDRCANGGGLLSKTLDPSSGPAVKMEDINQGLNLSRNLSSISGTTQYWMQPGGGGPDGATGNGNAWGSDLSHGFTSSTSHFL